MPQKPIHSYILIALVAIVAITAVTVILLTYAQKGALVGEASYPSSGSYQKGGAPDPTAIYTPPKTFCETVKNCNLSSSSPPVSGSPKVVDATGKEVGILVDADFIRETTSYKILVFNTNVKLFFKYDFRPAFYGPGAEIIASEVPPPGPFVFWRFYYDTADCTGPRYASELGSLFNFYLPLNQDNTEKYYQAVDINQVFPQWAKQFHSYSDASTGICVRGDVTNGGTAAVVEEIALPTYRRPLRIVVG